MNIGIIVHSHTGNTLEVAERLKTDLLGAGHSVILERLEVVNKNASAGGNVKLKEVPDASKYDVLIFGAPVWAFSLSSVMKAYLSQIPSLQNKKAGCFVTQKFLYPWMGGKRAVSQMVKACKSKGVDVFETGIVNWSHKEREKKIVDVLVKMGNL